MYVENQGTFAKLCHIYLSQYVMQSHTRESASGQRLPDSLVLPPVELNFARLKEGSDTFMISMFLLVLCLPACLLYCKDVS